MTDVEKYYDMTQKPWGQLFYKIVWAQLPNIKNKKILDFGSGFGITADHLAKNNAVTAIEPSSEMATKKKPKNKYTQIIGGIENFKELPNDFFDVLLCHNMLEYVKNKEEYIEEFARVLKNGGVLSLVKHNEVGKIMQKIVFENDLEQVMKYFAGKNFHSESFGEIDYYDKNDLRAWSKKYGFLQKDSCGVRMFFGLIQNNDIKFDEDWQKNIFDIEMKLCRDEPYKNVAMFEHIIVEKL